MKILKITPSVFLLSLMLHCAATAQQILRFKHTCSYDGDRANEELYAYDPSDEATNLVNSILELNGLSPNFILKTGNVKNAEAALDGKKRYITYNTTFFEAFKAGPDAQWAAYCVMAHEIAHHLNFDDMAEDDTDKRKLMELEADRYAGGMLFRLGATLEQAQAGIKNYTQEAGSKSHPPKGARMNSIAVGWKKAQETYRKQGLNQPKPIVQAAFINQNEPTRIEKVVLTDPSVLFKERKFDFEPEMVFVKGGTFQMGSNDGADDAKPVHYVTLSDFSIGKYEVTQKQWGDVVGTYPSNFRNCGDDCPVENVSWDDVQIYLSKLNEKTGKKYRLPTEAEWEYAARGGSFSKGFTNSGDNELENVAWYYANSGKKTQKIGKLKANELQIHDMNGNVWEFCSDYYNSGYYKLSNNTTNPQGPISGKNRVVRGGGYLNFGNKVNVHNRWDYVPRLIGPNIGFRVVRTD
jgi:formylglycine-generating enzyme required for sulfatase activity